MTVAWIRPNLTFVALAMLVPEMVTVVPTGPCVGLKRLMVGEVVDADAGERKSGRRPAKHVSATATNSDL